MSGDGGRKTIPCVVCHDEISDDPQEDDNWQCDECGRMYCETCFHGVAMDRFYKSHHLICVLCFRPMLDTKWIQIPTSIDTAIVRIADGLRSKIKESEKSNPK